MYISAYLHIYMYIHIHIDVHTYLCIHRRMFLRMHIYMSTWVNIYIRTCKYMYTYKYTVSSEIATYTFFSSGHARHGLQTAQAAALGNTAVYLAEPKTCATLCILLLSELRLLVVALLLPSYFAETSLLRLLLHRQLCATNEIVAHIHVEVGLLRWPPAKKQTHV